MIISFMQELTKEMLMQNYDQRHLISPTPPTMGFNDIARANTVENNTRSTATGEEKSLCSPVAGRFLWFPVVTGERKFLSSPNTMGEGESLHSPGVTGERESLHSPSVTGERKFLSSSDTTREKESLSSPNITEERKFLSSPDITGEREFLSSPEITGERESLGSPGVTGERESLSSPGATGEGKSRRLHMFDKVVTPSDVGKLNRLVIPKHHAQKYFPLDENEKDRGLLLTFEDKRGKEWRFRYSYWTSSQSYVFTKGWNGFVREMGLHAGDVVSFHTTADSPNMQRHFYISWQRRGSKAPLLCGGQAQIFRPSPFLMSSLQNNDGAAVFSMPTNGGAAVSSLFANGGAAMSSYASFRLEQTQGLLPSVAGHPAAGGERNTAFVQVKPGQRPAGDESYPPQKMSKRVRLFGVTL